MKTIKSVEEYLNPFPKEIKEKLLMIRNIILSSVPESVETIKYNMPTYVLNGKNLIHFAAFKNHIGIYPTPSPIEHFKDKLSTYVTSKGAIQILHTSEIPTALIQDIIKYRISEIKK